MTTREAAEAVLAIGYQTTSKNFANNVATALHADHRFVKRDGRWTIDESEVDESETEEEELD